MSSRCDESLVRSRRCTNRITGAMHPLIIGILYFRAFILLPRLHVGSCTRVIVQSDDWTLSSKNIVFNLSASIIVRISFANFNLIFEFKNVGSYIITDHCPA